MPCFSCLIASSKTVFNRGGKSRYLFSNCPLLRWYIYFFMINHSMTLAVILWYMSSIRLRKFSFFLIQSLFHERVFNFVKNFSHICWENHIFFSLLIWWNTLIGYLMLNSTCIPGINIWSWYLFINSLIQFAEVLLEDLLRTFISIFMEDIDFFILYFNFFLFSLKNV